MPYRTPLLVIAGVAFVLLVGGLVAPKKSKAPPVPPPPPADARAIVLSGDGTTRTIVIPTCGETTPGPDGNVRFSLSGTRTVLVPDCAAPTSPPSSAPKQSSALVLPVGADKLVDAALLVGTRQQVLVPAGSKARTIVVPPCIHGRAPGGPAKHQDVIISPAGATTATAPAC